MAQSSSSPIPPSLELAELGPNPSPKTPPQPQTTPSNPGPIMVEKTLSSTANLIKLLPGGTVLFFQALSPSFTNHGNCHTSNKYLTAILIGLSALSCCFFSFTDSFTGADGKLYHGIATFKGFYIFNNDNSEEEEGNVRSREMAVRHRIRVIDYVHAFFSCLVFLSLALSDSDLQMCFFERSEANTMELLMNLPLGIGLLSSLVFMIFPTRRKGFGGLGLIAVAGDNHGSENVLQSAAVKPIVNVAAGKKDSGGGIGFLDEIGGSVDGLMSCTESLGFESSDEWRKDDQMEEIDSETSRLRSKWRKTMARARREEVKNFPPPLSSLNMNGKRSFFLKPVRKDGRLELTEVRMDRPEILRAYRQDGRLRLQFIRFEETEAEDQDRDQVRELPCCEDREEESVRMWKFPVMTGEILRRCEELSNHISSLSGATIA
ncbi:hypothetical protein HHK36_026629 [Tetracentron sinense]|uniref:FAF domain-containing protein n=1 Tax=Tetracentron sinense TaxID=13715 RepID=A0A835D2C5_TETSI|nr:hypothetical protein HHK36_026629 [Tetracentron sinense]